jgi:hypothetical protein
MITVKRSLWIFALIILTFIGDRLGGWVLKQWVEDSQFRYSRLYTGRAESDILLVGNSRGLIFFQPYIETLTGEETFNLSYNGMSVDLMHQLIQDYYDRYPSPRLMLIDVTMVDRINDQLTVGFNTYGQYSERLNDFIIDRGGNMGYAAEVSHLFRYNSEIFQRALFYSNKSDKDWLLDRVINQSMIDAATDLEPYQISLRPDTTSQAMRSYLPMHLKGMIDFAQQNGTKVVLLVNPYYPAFEKSIENLDSFISDIERLTGLEVLDYSAAITDEKAFGDYQHLNQYGAKLYLDLLHNDGIFDK